MTDTPARRSAPLAAVAAMLLALAAVPASAFLQPASGAASAPEETGDQLIVKYRGSGTPTAAALARTQATGKTFGVKLTPLRRMSGGEQIFKLDKPLPASALQRLSQQLRSDADVEYAEPDLMQHPQRGPGGIGKPGGPM